MRGTSKSVLMACALGVGLGFFLFPDSPMGSENDPLKTEIRAPSDESKELKKDFKKKDLKPRTIRDFQIVRDCSFFGGSVFPL